MTFKPAKTPTIAPPDSTLIRVTLPPEAVMPADVYLRRLAATLSGRAFYYAQGLALHSLQGIHLGEFATQRGMPSAAELLSDDGVNPSNPAITERMYATLTVTANVLDVAPRYKTATRRPVRPLQPCTLKFTVKVEVPVYSVTRGGVAPTQAVVIYNTVGGGFSAALQDHMAASVVRAMQTLGVTHAGRTFDTTDRMAAPPFEPDSAYAPWACLPVWGVLPLMPVDGRYGDMDMDITPVAPSTVSVHASMMYTPEMVARAMDSLKLSAWGRGIPPPLYSRWATDPLTRPWEVPPCQALRHAFTGVALPRDTGHLGQAEREFLVAGVTRAQMLGLRDLPMGSAWMGVDDMTAQHMKRCARAAVPVRHTTYRTRMESIQVEMLR